MAGNGDMFGPTVELAASLGIGRYVTFTGFLQGPDLDKIFRMADLYVMPSVSEPFGIAPLEALSYNVPVIIPRQSRVAEVLRHALKVDFWDIRQMADKIISVLTRPVLGRLLRQNGAAEVRNFSWTTAGRSCLEVYRSVVSRGLESSSPRDFFCRDFDALPAAGVTGVN